MCSETNALGVKNILYEKLKKYSLNDAIFFEQKDRQFLALKKLAENKKISKEKYLFLIITNSLICYQLSGKWEDYWEEFSEFFMKKDFKNFEELFELFRGFLPESKNNKRFVNIKLKRIKKLENFYLEFLGKEKYFYENMEELLEILSKTMNQKKEAKTIVFAIKMFSYWARNIFNYIEKFPENIMIPIDSRLEKLYEKYNNYPIPNPSLKTKGRELYVKIFYKNLSKKLKIALLHLDAILWVNYDELMK